MNLNKPRPRFWTSHDWILRWSRVNHMIWELIMRRKFIALRASCIERYMIVIKRNTGPLKYKSVLCYRRVWCKSNLDHFWNWETEINHIWSCKILRLTSAWNIQIIEVIFKVEHRGLKINCVAFRNDGPAARLTIFVIQIFYFAFCSLLDEFWWQWAIPCKIETLKRLKIIF